MLYGGGDVSVTVTWFLDSFALSFKCTGGSNRLDSVLSSNSSGLSGVHLCLRFAHACEDGSRSGCTSTHAGGHDSMLGFL